MGKSELKVEFEIKPSQISKPIRSLMEALNQAGQQLLLERKVQLESALRSGRKPSLPFHSIRDRTRGKEKQRFVKRNALSVIVFVVKSASKQRTLIG